MLQNLSLWENIEEGTRELITNSHLSLKTFLVKYHGGCFILFIISYSRRDKVSKDEWITIG